VLAADAWSHIKVVAETNTRIHSVLPEPTHPAQ
jgi:hypothetical protein